MKTEKIIEHITKSFNKYLDDSGMEKHFPNFKQDSWKDLIIRESEAAVAAEGRDKNEGKGIKEGKIDYTDNLTGNPFLYKLNEVFL